MSVRVYVPRDSAALSVGAEGVARAIASEAASRKLDITLVRNGSRGMFWLEPLVEVETSQGRIAYGPVSRESVAGLFDAGFLEGKTHALGLGPTEEIPYLKQQERLTFARCGIVDPLSMDDYIAHGGYRGLQAALALDTAGNRRRPSKHRDCAGAAARDSPPESSGTPSCTPRPIKNTSAAMPTRAIAEPTPTA